MRNITLCVVLLVLSGCSCHENFSAYRYNPFQFVYPEYQLKAEVTEIPSTSFSTVSGTPIDFFGLNAMLPPQWEALAKGKTVKENEVVFKSGKDVVIVSREKANLLGCEYSEFREGNKDFCAAFESIEDFYWKLYTLTPELLSKEKYPTSGQQWIVHKKGFFFELIERIKIYKGQGVTVYRSDYKPSFRLSTNLIIFHNKLQPDYLVISTTIKDEATINALVGCNEKTQR